MDRVSADQLIRWGLDDLPDTSIMIFDHEMRYVLVRGAAVRQAHMDPDLLEGRLAAECLETDRWQFYRPRYEAALRGETTSDEVVSPDGLRTYAIRCGPVRDPGDAIVGGAATAVDITAVRAEERARRESDERLRLSWEAAPAGMALVSLDRRILEANNALAAILERDPADLAGSSLDDFLDPEDIELDLALRQQARSSESGIAKSERRIITASGAVRWVDHSIAVMRNDDNEPIYYLSQFADITETRSARERLEYLARRDPLTGLANRHELFARGGEWVGAGEPITALFADLDGFKQINDELGHAAGDEVLRIAGERMAARVRSEDLLARFGGDEFVVLVRGGYEVADRVAAHLRDALSEPINTSVGAVSIGVTVGLAAGAPGDSLDEIIGRADIALYDAKPPR